MTRRRKILIGVATLFIGLFVIWPTVNALRIRHKIASSVENAESVRLEEFTFHVPLVSVELPRAEWSEVTAHLPIVPDIGIPGSVKMCFIPHHRIVITGPNRQQFVFTVCFGCDQATIGKSGIFAVPYLWSKPLRDLFTSYQIRIRSDREYTDASFSNIPSH